MYMVDISRDEFFRFDIDPEASTSIKKEYNLVTLIESHRDYITFIARPESTQLYKIKPYTIGRQSIKEINLAAHPIQIINIGKNVTKKILGIGIKNENVETKLINIDRINEIRIPEDLTEYGAANQSDLDIYRVHSHIRMNFNEQVIRYEYYSTVDILSSLGGIGASVMMIINFLGFLFIINFMVNFSRIIRRQTRFKTKR